MFDINKVLARLNEAYEADPVAIDALFSRRMLCNDKLAEHPTICAVKTKFGTAVGILGILNGVLADFTSQRLAMKLDEKTGGVTGFCLWKEDDE